MPGGVVFLVCIPSMTYEHVLKFGKPQVERSVSNVEIQQNDQSRSFKLEVGPKAERRDHIPVYMTQAYYNNAYSQRDDLGSNDEVIIPMEKILEELLKKLDVEHAVWWPDKPGNYWEVFFPVTAGDSCENMLHCLTQLGIGVRSRSVVSVLPCSVFHSSISSDNKEQREDVILRNAEERHRWRCFVESVRSKLTVRQVVEGVRGGGEMSFDYLTLIITADSLAALGLVENNSPNIVAAMLVSPLMGPVMSITFGFIISDRSLMRSGIISLVVGMLLSLLFGFIFGLILGTTEMPWGFGDWPTEEMKSRGNVRSLWMGVLWALTSGTGVAVALLQGSAGPLIGVAISASLLPPVVNCGLFWALGCIWLLYDGVKIPHIKGEKYYGNSTYQPIYHDYIPIEFAVNGIVSACLTVVNVICIFITAIVLLKIKEVAAPYTSSPDLQRFWQHDIKLAREDNKANMRAAEEDERREYMMDEVNDWEKDGMQGKLEEAIKEAVDDDTFRKIKRISYQSHTADEVTRSLALYTLPNNQLSHRTSVTSAPAPYSTLERPRSATLHDIATLDKIIASLLDAQSKDGRGSPHRRRHSRSFLSHRFSNRSSTSSNTLPTIDEDTVNRRRDAERKVDSWPDRVFDNAVVQSVLSSLRVQPGRRTDMDEPFLTPKAHSQDDSVSK